MSTAESQTWIFNHPTSIPRQLSSLPIITCITKTREEAIEHTDPTEGLGAFIMITTKQFTEFRLLFVAN